MNTTDSKSRLERVAKNVKGISPELQEKAKPGTINVFFVQSLNGINGLALLSMNAALVADRTTVNDYRTTAHEIGHLLGLRHVNPPNRLMARGRNGELLTLEEALASREAIQR